ncbi:hypothetical protein JXA12_03950 [Candidatus Woesearchaeota archaeon]|nr:hypothetical protein [Candidatus Woesearchaeota archaeon]
MKQAITIFIFFLTISAAAADITLITSEEKAEEPTRAFTITSGDAITITTPYDYDRVTVFIDGENIDEYENAQAGDAKTYKATTGNHDVEARGLKKYTYTWEDYNTLKDDEPVKLAYAKYDKSDREVKFILEGADIIHPNRMNTTTKSFKDSYDDYAVTINQEQQLNCYPSITTGEDVFFSCRTMGTYAHRIDIEATLGVREQRTVSVNAAETGKDAQETITETDETPIANDIELHDTIKEPATPIPLTAFVILLFLSFATILFIASHHTYESKLAGTHHPQKKRK